jgi:hypothetical protein
MSKEYEVLVKYYEAKRITIELEKNEDLEEKIKEYMQLEEDVTPDMIIDYEVEE